ncbi:MAG: hypothetical protein GTO46_02000 [Gemmatimonadetes bacterium]|nr:hypothetical protein [Gemmatimonadota bacterium]NIO30570.1 hypothetical protein [Gemmatimonadota bacterium]
MSLRRIEGIEWYVDRKAEEHGEPGIYHSYMASLATAINHVAGSLDPAWLMGSSGFAFRSFISQVFCPSAMSIFKWADVLPEAMEQAGYECEYISRMWDDGHLEDQRREEAHVALVEAVGRGVPAIVWDVADVEWGLIVGYDDDKRLYDVLSYVGKSTSLPYKKLGKNGIDVLSVAIPGRANGRNCEEIVLNSLRVAIAHADGEEWTERPDYQNGLAGLDLWATMYDRWAMLVGAGKGENLPLDLVDWAAYYAGHHYSARCYARDYLEAVAGESEPLRQAASSYATVACHLRPVWEHACEKRPPESVVLSSLADHIRDALLSEARAIDYIREHVEDR